MYYSCICDIFFSSSGYPTNSLFPVSGYIYKMFLMKHFSSYYQNVYGHQTLQGGDMLRWALTLKYAWHLDGVILWGHVTNKILISTCRRCIDTTLDKVPCWLSVRGLQTWPFEQMTNVSSVCKIYIFHFHWFYS